MNCDQLIVQIGLGYMQALEALYDELYSAVYGFLLSIVRDAELAADLSQDTFVKVYQNASKFHTQGQGKAWVMKIARNLAFDELKRRKREQPAEFLPEDSGYDHESILYLKQNLAMLSPSERRLVMLKAYGYSHKEIAQIDNLPQGTVRWKYARAVKKLKEMQDITV